MNRREFLKTTAAIAAFAPIAGMAQNNQAAAKADKPADKAESDKKQVSRRAYRGTDMTLPLLGFGMMRMPRINPAKPDIDYAKAEKQIARAMEAGDRKSVV